MAKAKRMDIAVSKGTSSIASRKRLRRPTYFLRAALNMMNFPEMFTDGN